MENVFQFAIFDYNSSVGNEEKEMASFSPSQPREKWQRKTTFIKIKVINTTVTNSLIIILIILILYRILLRVIEQMT